MKTASTMIMGDDLIRLMRDGPEMDVEEILGELDVSRVVNLTGWTLLHYAASSGNDVVTSYLLERGCNPDARDAKGITPLMLAIEHRHNLVIRSLLQENVDLDIASRSARTALDMAFAANDGLHMDTMKMLLDKARARCPSGGELLDRLLKRGCQMYHAVFLRDHEFLEGMLHLGYEVDAKHPTDGYTALHIAASQVDLQSVRLLLRLGADFNAVDCDLQSPLFYLYNHGSDLTREKLDILRLLLDSGVSLMTHTTRGFYQVGPALTRACKSGIRLIFKTGAIDLAAKDGFDEKTVLHHLAMNGNRGVVEVLQPYLEQFDVNALDKWGVTPLYSATEDGHVEMVEFLLENGANPNVRCHSFGYTPLCFAVLKFQGDSADHYDRCTELLLQYGADPQLTFSANTNDDSELTIFDNALITRTYARVKSVIAHLAMLESKGVALEKLTYSKIQSLWIFQDYLESCRKFLRKSVLGDVKFLELFTASDKIVARRLRDEKLVLKLTHISYKNEVKAYYPYYYNTLKKRISKLLHRMRLEDNATEPLCAIFEGRFASGHLVVQKIFSYLDNSSLYCLCHLKKTNRCI